MIVAAKQEAGSGPEFPSLQHVLSAYTSTVGLTPPFIWRFSKVIPEFGEAPSCGGDFPVCQFPRTFENHWSNRWMDGRVRKPLHPTASYLEGGGILRGTGDGAASMAGERGMGRKMPMRSL